MLNKSSRKELLEHNWLWIQEHDTNPTQKLSRYVEHAITSINDLILFTQKLPETTLSEMFTEPRIRQMLGSILYEEQDFLSEKFEKINSHKLLIASTIVEVGIKFCISQYEKSFSDTPSLTRSTISDLQKTIENCKDISYKMSVSDIENEGEQRKYEYLFDLNNFPRRGTNRVLRFLWKETGSPINRISKFATSRDISRVSFSVDAEIDLVWKVEIDIELDRGKAFLVIFDENGEPTRGLALMVKLQNNVIHFYRPVK